MDNVPDTALLTAFEHLYRERNLTRAAARLGTSQPSMSRMLSQLRATFDDPLFVRAPGGVLPTPRADALAPEIEAVLDRARALVRRERFEPSRLTRTFVVATSDLVEQHLVAGVVHELAARAPSVDVSFRPLVGETQTLLASGVDLVVGLQAQMPPGAMSAHLFDDGFVCAVRRGHPTVKRVLTLEAFCAVPHVQIAPRGTPGGPVDDALAARGLARRVAVRTSSFLVAPIVAARSDLILTGPSRMLLPMAKAFDLVTFPPPLALEGFRIHQGWHARAHEDPAHAWFRGLVAAVARGKAGGARAPRVT